MNYKEKYNEALERARALRQEAINKEYAIDYVKDYEAIFPELAESEDERIRKEMIGMINECTNWAHKKEYVKYLEKQKENLKSADSISPDCTSDVKCEDRWHKVGDSLPDNGRLVLAKDCLGNVLLARYDGENWEVNVYDNEDHYCHNSISKWCEIPSEKQKEQKPTWSDEDEASYNAFICEVVNEKMNPTIEQVKWLRGICDRLKSLKPQPHWKPSEEQMKALQNAVALTACDKELARLYNQLQKL